MRRSSRGGRGRGGPWTVAWAGTFGDTGAGAGGVREAPLRADGLLERRREGRMQTCGHFPPSAVSGCTSRFGHPGLGAATPVGGGARLACGPGRATARGPSLPLPQAAPAARGTSAPCSPRGADPRGLPPACPALSTPLAATNGVGAIASVIGATHRPGRSSSASTRRPGSCCRADGAVRCIRRARCQRIRPGPPTRARPGAISSSVTRRRARGHRHARLRARGRYALYGTIKYDQRYRRSLDAGLRVRDPRPRWPCGATARRGTVTSARAAQASRISRPPGRRRADHGVGHRRHAGGSARGTILGAGAPRDPGHATGWRDRPCWPVAVTSAR